MASRRKEEEDRNRQTRRATRVLSPSSKGVVAFFERILADFLIFFRAVDAFIYKRAVNAFSHQIVISCAIFLIALVY